MRVPCLGLWLHVHLRKVAHIFMQSDALCPRAQTCTTPALGVAVKSGSWYLTTTSSAGVPHVRAHSSVQRCQAHVGQLRPALTMRIGLQRLDCAKDTLHIMQYTKILVKLGYSCTFRDFTVQNMVASCSVNFPIRLEGLAAHFDMFVHYEPEVFPGLVFRMHTPKVVLLIFVTGKLVITGAKNIGDIHTAFDNIYAVLQDHRKGDARRLVRTEPNTPAAAITANGEVRFCVLTVLRMLLSYLNVM